MNIRSLRNGAFAGLLLMCLGLLLMPAAVQAQDGEGEAEAPVVMTEYSDYQCPACGYFHPIVKKLKEEFGEQLHINYKFFPLNSHQYAALSARAAQAARNQGKFLEMHNMLFEGQRRWSSSPNPQPIFMSYAREIGLDMAQFRSDLNSAEAQRTVMEEKREGQNMGVNATPTFIINGTMLETPPSTFEEFRKVIQGYLDKAQSQ